MVASREPPIQKSSPVMSAAAQPPVRSQMMPDDEDEDESSGIFYLVFVSVDQGQHTQNIVLYERDFGLDRGVIL